MYIIKGERQQQQKTCFLSGVSSKAKIHFSKIASYSGLIGKLSFQATFALDTFISSV